MIDWILFLRQEVIQKKTFNVKPTLFLGQYGQADVALS